MVRFHCPLMRRSFSVPYTAQHRSFDTECFKRMEIFGIIPECYTEIGEKTLFLIQWTDDNYALLEKFFEQKGKK
jgi:hypothetical protein